MSEPPKRKPPKLGPRKTAPSSTQKPASKAQSSSADGKPTATPAKKPAVTTAKPKTTSTDDQKPKPSDKTSSSSAPQQKPNSTDQPKDSDDAPPKKTATTSSQAPKPPAASRTTSTPSAKPDPTEQRRPPKLPPKPSNDGPTPPSDERRSSAVSRKASTPAAKPETTEEKRKPPKLPPKTSNAESAAAKPEDSEQKRKPPKLSSKANNATPSTDSRRPSTAPHADSQPSVKSTQKPVKEEQDLKSALSEEQRTDLSQLISGIARQMRKTIEDNFDSAADLKTLGNNNMSEDEKIASADFDTGTVDVGTYDKERKLREERKKELAKPKLKELKRTALEWFDDWRNVVQKRVDETLEPKKGSSQEKEVMGPSLAEQRPVQKVNTDAKSGEYSPPKLEELFPRLHTSLTKLPVQKRVLVLHAILLLLLSLEQYNAASRVLLLYLASSLKLGLKYLREDEEQTAQGLLQAAKEVSADEEALKRRKEQGKEARKWRVRLATAAGAGVVGVAGGLAAPMIAAGVGTVMGGIGLEATTAAGYLGSLASSSYLVGGLFGAYGGRMTGDMMEELSAEVEDFAFLPVHGERKAHDKSIEAATESRRLRVIIAISGWLLEKEEVVTPWRVLKPSAEVFALRFELQALMNLGQSIDTMISSTAYGYAQSAMIQRTVFAELMSAMWPVALVKVARVVDNPFTLAKNRADKAGKVLAEALINRTQGERPVTLIGYSLGARVIWSCLTTLCEKKAFGLVESAVLMGSPLPSDTSTWRKMRTAVSGRLVNVYSENDYLLAFLYRTSSLQYGVAGLMPVSGLHGLENVDVSETVSGHLRYRYLVGSILQKIGFEDIDKDEVEKEAEAFKKVVEEESKHSYIEQAKEGYKGNKSGKPPKPPSPKDISDADADKQATAMEKEVQAKTQKGLMQWAVEQLYIAKPSVPSAGNVKGAGAAKTASKTADAATKSLYQRAIEAAYLARSGGEEGQKAAQDKLAEAQLGGPSSYLATAAGYIPTSYIPSLGRASNVKKAPEKDLGKAGKPPLKKTASAQRAVGDAARPALKKTDSMQKKVGDAAKDPGKTASDAQKTVTDVAKDPSKAAANTQKQVKDASKGVTDAATTAGKKAGQTASDPSKAAAEGQKQAGDAVKSGTETATDAGKAVGQTASDPSKTAKEGQKQVGDAAKTATDTATNAGKAVGQTASDPSKAAKEGQKQVGDAAKKAGGVTSYLPSFGLGGSSKTEKPAAQKQAPKEASNEKPSSSNKQDDVKTASKSLAQRAEESVAAENNKAAQAKEDAQKKGPSGSAKKKVSNDSRPKKEPPQKEPSGSAEPKSSGYSSYLPHFGFGGSKSKPATPDTKKATKDAPKPESTAKDATKKTEDASKDAPKPEETAKDAPKKTEDASEDAPKPEETAKDAPKKTEDASKDAQKTASEASGKAQSTAKDTAANVKDSGEDIFTSPSSKSSNAFTKAASSATSGASNAAGFAGNAATTAAGSATDAASGAGKTVTDGAMSAQKYTPSMGGLGGDAGSKFGEMAGGAALGAKSGASFLGQGIGSAAQFAGTAQSKRGETAQEVSDKAGDEVDKAMGDEEGKGNGYGKMASGLAGVGSRDKMVGNAVNQAGKGLTSFAGGETEEKEPEAKEAKSDNNATKGSDESDGDADRSDDAKGSQDEDSDEASQVTEIPSRPIKMLEHEDEHEEDTHSDYDSASEEVQSQDEGSHKAEGSPSSDEHKGEPTPPETEEESPKDAPAKSEEPKSEEAKEAETKGYLGSAGSAVSSAGQGVYGGAASAGSAAGGAASSAASGVAGGVGMLGKPFGWG